MRLNHPVTHRERQLSDDDQLISTTTLKGLITGVNEVFCAVSGFAEDELVGQAHNIVRHPDMPQQAFKKLWDDIKAGKPWLGLVKNRCKSGDHYYVDAYVTPIFEGDRMVGYQSVRTKPERAVIERAEAIYRDIRNNTARPWARLHPAALSYCIKPWLFAVPVLVPGLIAAALGHPIAAFTALLCAVMAGAMGVWLVAPLRALARSTESVVNDPLGRSIYTGRRDEVGQLAHVLRVLRMQNRTIIGRVSHAADVVATIAQRTDAVVAQTTTGVRQQQLEVEQVATAMNEMTATVAEVARHAEETARASQQVLEQTGAGTRQVEAAIHDIENLSRVVGEASDVIERLQGESEQIGSVVDVISNIASETNLLALNAAIEAARAGEQGRGFAVVADEVRSLAQRTQESTQEIQAMIERLQAGAQEAVRSMADGTDEMERTVQRASRAGESLSAIASAVSLISDMNTQIASATEEQMTVSQEISRNVVNISDVARSSEHSVQEVESASLELKQSAQRLAALVNEFTTG